MPEADAAPPDAEFSLKTATRIKADWLGRDLLFLTRSLRYLPRPQGVALRRQAGLEAGEIGILAVVGLNPGNSRNDLAATVVLRKSAVTRIVQALEGGGLIARARSATDRRMNRLMLTAAGEQVIGGVRRATQALQDDWFDRIPAAQRAAFFAVLVHLVERLAATAGEGGEDDDA